MNKHARFGPDRLILLSLLTVAVILSGCRTAAPSGPTVVVPVTFVATPTSSAAPTTAPTAASTTRPIQASTATAPTAAATTATDSQAGAVAPATSVPDTAATAIVTPTALPAADPPLKPALQKFIDGLERPTYLTFAPSSGAGIGAGPLYVTEQPGRIRLIQKGQLVPGSFLDITDRVGSSGNEQGLLSIAFPPDFVTSRKLYVYYTDTNGDVVVAGFLAARDGLSADPGSAWTIIKVNHPYANHNGGQLKFGPDGMLYIGLGDGGNQGDPQNRAQNRNELLGKILRLDVTHSTASAPYAVPDNKASSGRAEIWALGLRNPWRFSFDRTTAELYIADVGQDLWEEVDMLPANSAGGTNFGWKVLEGTHRYSSGSTAGFTSPVWEYAHGNDGCSVIGGYVYRGTAITALSGAYIYGDYCSGRIWALRRDASGKWTNTKLFDSGYSITSFGEDAQGELYVLNHDGGIAKIGGA